MINTITKTTLETVSVVEASQDSSVTDFKVHFKGRQCHKTQ